MIGSNRIDRFGFPLRIAIDFRRRMFEYEQDLARRTRSDEIHLQGAKYLIDRKPDEALQVIELQRRPSQADLQNVEMAHAMLGRFTQEHVATNAGSDGVDVVRAANVVIPFATDTGGMQVQVDIARMLAEDGYHVNVLQLRSDDLTRSALLDHDVNVLAVGDHAELEQRLRQSKAAFTMVGCWVDYLPAIKADCGPIVGFSGGEPTLNEASKLDARFMAYRSSVHQLPVHLLTCSKFIQSVYREEFGRSAHYVPAAINSAAFETTGLPVRDRPFRALMVARDSLEDKGLDYAIPALESLRDREGLDIEIVWITPESPKKYPSLRCELHVDPKKEDLYEIMRTTHALVYPPIIDGLGLPPLEAMACGVAVLVTKSGGPDEFSDPGVNCLLVEKKSVSAIKEAVKKLYFDRDLRTRLVKCGFKTAEKYRRETVRAQLLKYFEKVCRSHPDVKFGSSERLALKDLAR